MVSLERTAAVFAAGARPATGLPDLTDFAGLPELPAFSDRAELATDLVFSFGAGVGSFLAGLGASRPVGFCAMTSIENRAVRSVRKIAHEGFLPIMFFNNLLMNSDGNEYAGVY